MNIQLSENSEEKFIREDRMRLRAIVDTIPDLVWLKDTNGIYLMCNPKFEDFFGHKEAEIIGKTDFDFVPEELARFFRQKDKEALEANKPSANTEWITYAGDGHREFVETIKTPMYSSDGKAIGILGIARDITDKKQIMNDLTIAKERAEESDRLKSAFLNNISHEVRTPLNAIAGFSALLTIPDNPPDTISMYVDTILRSCDQLMSVVHDIIDMSNIEAKASNIIIRKVNLKSFVEKLYNQFLPAVSDKNLILKINPSLSSKDIELLTDSSKLEKIFSNLIGNAIKFSQKGTIIFGYEPRGSIIEFFVTDSGIGIPKEEHVKIFEKFYQVEKSLNRQFEGAGLGLSICKAFVEDLKGKIWLESESGSGSTFYFSLPFTEAAKEVSEIKAPEPLFALQNAHKNALVAEDNQNNFILIKTYLATINFNAIHAVNGKEAVEICKSRKDIDLILMDIKMPLMDGYAAIKEIRKFFPEVVIIVQTAYPENKENAKSKGCNDFISKPFTIDQFISKIKENISLP